MLLAGQQKGHLPLENQASQIPKICLWETRPNTELSRAEKNKD